MAPPVPAREGTADAPEPPGTSGGSDAAAQTGAAATAAASAASSSTTAESAAGGAPGAAGDRAAQDGAAGAPTGPTRRLSDTTLALVVGLVTLPILWMGYGTDIDVANVLDTVDRIHDGGYRPSRTPGVPVFEGLAAVLDPVGGHLLLNLATAVAAAATVVGIARLVTAWGHDNGDLIALAFLASPVTVVAASSVGDFVWALVFLVWGALVHLRAPTSTERVAGGGPRRPVWWRHPNLWAGLLFGLAAGSRLSTGLLVAAFLVADGWERSHRGRCLRSALAMVPVAVALYVPAWLSFDRTLGFLETTETYRGFVNNLGRFLYKNYATAGPLLIVVLLVAAPALVAALRRWGSDPLLRFGALAFVVSQALYFQLPLKVAHLLPALLALLLWLAASRRNQRPFLWVLTGALAVNGLVTLRLLAPDDAHDATTARWDPSLTAGLLVNDIDCRLRYMDEPPDQSQNAAWNCALEPVRSPTAAD